MGCKREDLEYFMSSGKNKGGIICTKRGKYKPPGIIQQEKF
jgi:hypothetical protein